MISALDKRNFLLKFWGNTGLTADITHTNDGEKSSTTRETRSTLLGIGCLPTAPLWRESGYEITSGNISRRPYFHRFIPPQ